MMRSWRQWTRFASRRVLWNRYLFQYRRRIARSFMQKHIERWKGFVYKNIEARKRREEKRRFRSESVANDDYFDEESSRSDSSNSDEDEVLHHMHSSPSVINWSMEWRKRSKNADSKLRGLQEGALPEDRLDETVLRRMLINTNELFGGELSQPSNLNTDQIDRGGNTPLHIACGRGDAKRVQELIKEGWCVNATNHSYESPLHCAARHLPMMFLPVVVRLLECGASLDMEDINGATPIDLAINPQISFLLRRHRQRMENYEFTSKERQWYRRMRISHWESVDHTELWQEVVHLFLLQKNVDKDRNVGNQSAGRPQSRRSRTGGISDARMERIRRIQKGAHDVLEKEQENNVLLAEPSGWFSPRCTNNQWTSRYQRALAFLRTRKALENSGYQSLVQAQTAKCNRRIRRMKRRMARDKLLLANAYLRKTVMDYESMAKQVSYMNPKESDDSAKESSDEEAIRDQSDSSNNSDDEESDIDDSEEEHSDNEEQKTKTKAKAKKIKRENAKKKMDLYYKCRQSQILIPAQEQQMTCWKAL